MNKIKAMPPIKINKAFQELIFTGGDDFTVKFSKIREGVENFCKNHNIKNPDDVDILIQNDAGYNNVDSQIYAYHERPHTLEEINQITKEWKEKIDWEMEKEIENKKKRIAAEKRELRNLIKKHGVPK